MSNLFNYLLRYYLKIRSGLLLVLSLLSSLYAYADISTTTITFNVDFVSPTCELSLNTTSINLGTVAMDQLTNAGKTGLNPQNFTLSFKNCKGAGGTPKVVVTAAGNNGSFISDNTYLFRSNVSATTSSGFGVRLDVKNIDSTTTSLAHNSKIAIGTAADNIATTTPKPLTFTASLSCGDCTQVINYGDLEASVNLAFLYE